MRRALVAGNWKMHGSGELARTLLAELIEELGGGVNGTDLVVCPPAPYLGMVGELMRGSELILGAQNAYSEQEGAFTGEISPRMLGEFSVRYVIAGHSERRRLFGESDELVARKFAAIQAEAMRPILCVGETLEEREQGRAMEVVAHQIGRVLEKTGVGGFERAVVAYEPVWAIGTGRTASPEQAQEMHEAIRNLIGEQDPAIAEALRIVYGGSVNDSNAGELFACADIDGALVGGASLKGPVFTRICNSVS